MLRGKDMMILRQQNLSIIDLSSLTLDNLATIFAMLGALSAVTTSFVAVLNYRLASKKNQLSDNSSGQIYGEQPWTLAKISPTRWILIRNHSKPATLYAYRTDNHNALQIEYRDTNEGLSGVFSKGNYVTLKVTGPIGGTLSLYYREYTEASQADPQDYQGELSRQDSVPTDVSEWSIKLR
jgi:hypothetical protein